MESTQDTTTTTNEKPKRTMSPELKEKLAIARRKALEAKKANKTNSQVEFSNPVPEPVPVAPVAPVPEAPVPEPVKKPRKPRSKKEPVPEPEPEPEPVPAVAPVPQVPDEPVKPAKQKSRKSKPLIIMEDSDSDESTDQQVIYIPRRKSSSRRKALPELPIPQAPVPVQQAPVQQAPAPPVPQMPRVHRQPGMFYYTSSFM